MANMRLVGDFNAPEMECDACDVRFTLYWQRKAYTTQVSFCPFCGEEVDETIDELTTPPQEQE